MNEDDERYIVAQEVVEETQAELDNTIVKELDKRNMVVETLALDVSGDFTEISGKVLANGKEVDLVATLDAAAGNWDMQVDKVKLSIPAEDLDFELSELEEAKDNLAALEEGADEEDMDHPDGEDEDYDD